MAYSYSIEDPAKNRKRTLAFALVVIIHVLFFWVLASGLGAKMVQTIVGPVETKIIDEQPKEKEEPPPPPPDIEQPPPYVPPPEVSVDTAVDTSNSTAISNATNERPVATPPPAPKPVEHKAVITPPATAGKGARVTQPEYPPSSRRAGETGTVILSIYVLESGKVADAKVAKSSGFEKLDEAAVNEAKRNWRLVPGKEDGKPVAMWHQVAVTFKLQD